MKEDISLRRGGTRCHAWIVRRRDGQTFGFTDHDKPVRIYEVVCHASSGLSAGALETGTGLSVDNVDFLGALTHDVVSPEDIRHGIWDEAEVTVYLLDWANGQENEIIFDGNLGEISVEDGKFHAELRSKTQRLNRVRGRVYEPHCDASLGDHRCGLELDEKYSSSGVIEAFSGPSSVLVTFDKDMADSLFRYGKLYIAAGGERTFIGTIKTDRKTISGRILSIWETLPSDLSVGLQILAVAGCDKNFDTCVARFDNAVNYRGFSTIPGEDWLMKHPSIK